MPKLEKLKEYAVKKYSINEKEEYEEIDQGEDYFIKNYSGGISLGKIIGQIKPLKPANYRVLKDDISGDAPKDFIQVYEFGGVKKSYYRQWDRYIAKVGHKWYPLESISEYLLNRIGEVLGLNMAYSQLRTAHGQLRFLSKYFLKEDDILMHGAQIYSAYLLETNDLFVEEIENEDMARDLLTFQVTDEAIKTVFPQEYKTIMNDLVKLLVFDAITGNNDRHFYNWAIITDLRGKRSPRFSPIYDSARGLFWNRDESVINRKFFEGKGKKIHIHEKNLDKYLQSSRPKIGWEDWQGKKQINHFQLIELINKHYPQHQDTCKRLIKNVYLHEIFAMLDKEFITFYTPKRYKLIKACLTKRFELLQQLCKL